MRQGLAWMRHGRAVRGRVVRRKVLRRCSLCEPGKKRDGFVISGSEAAAKTEPGQQVLRPTFTVGALAVPTGLMDREITFATPLPVVDWHSGDRARAGALVQVRTRPSVLYTHLFAALGDFAQGVEYILLAVLIILR